MKGSDINKIKEEAIIREGRWTQGQTDLIQCAKGYDKVCIWCLGT